MINIILIITTVFIIFLLYYIVDNKFYKLLNFKFVTYMFRIHCTFEFNDKLLYTIKTVRCAGGHS